MKFYPSHLLILPIFFPEHKGAHRWIDLKVMSLQPSEIALLMDLFDKNKDGLISYTEFLAEIAPRC